MYQNGSKPPVTMTFFLVHVWLWEVVFGASSVSSHWAGCCRLSCKIYFLLRVRIQSRNGSLLCRIREDNALKRCFWFAVSSWGTHLSSFFTFPICLKCQMTIEWSTLSSSAASRVVVRGSALMIALNLLLSASGGWPLFSSSSSLWLPLQNFLNHHCLYVH